MLYTSIEEEMLLIDNCLRQAQSETKAFQNETKNINSLMGLNLKISIILSFLLQSSIHFLPVCGRLVGWHSKVKQTVKACNYKRLLKGSEGFLNDQHNGTYWCTV